MKHLHHKPGSFKEAQEREHYRRAQEVEIVRTWEVSWGLEEGWEPRSRSKSGAAPLAAESANCKEAFSEAIGGKSRSSLFSGWVAGGEDDFWPSQLSRRLYLENRWLGLLVHGGPLSPQPGLGCLPAAWLGVQPPPSLPWFLPISGCGLATSSCQRPI